MDKLKVQRRLISVEDAAEILGISPSTLRGYAYRGSVASHKLGARLMFAVDEVERVIRESERPRLPRLGQNSDARELR